MANRNTSKTDHFGSQNDFMQGTGDVVNDNPFNIMLRDYVGHFDGNVCTDLLNDTFGAPINLHSSFTELNSNGTNFFEQDVLEMSQQGNHYDDLYYTMKQDVLPTASPHFSDLAELNINVDGDTKLSSNNAENVVLESVAPEIIAPIDIPMKDNLYLFDDKTDDENNTSTLQQLTAPNEENNLSLPIVNENNKDIPIVSDNINVNLSKFGVVFDETNICFNEITKLNHPKAIIEPFKSRQPKCVPKIIQYKASNVIREEMSYIVPKAPAKPRKKYERRAKPADGTDVRKPRKKYVRKNKADKFAENFPIVPTQQLQSYELPKRVSNSEHPLNFADMGISANQNDLLILSPVRTRKFVSTRRSAVVVSSLTTVSNTANTDNAVNDDRAPSTPALSLHTICDFNRHANENSRHLMTFKIPIINEPNHSKTPNPNRRKQKLQIIQGSENYEFEILNRRDLVCSVNEFEYPLVDPYMEASIPEVEDIFTRRKRDCRKVYRNDVNIYDEDTMFSPPKRQHFAMIEPLKHKSQLVSPQEWQLGTFDQKSSKKEQNSKPIETEVYQIQTTASPPPRADRQPKRSDFVASKFLEDNASLSMKPLDPSNIKIIQLKSLDPDKDEGDSEILKVNKESLSCQKCRNQFISQLVLAVHQMHCGVNDCQSQVKEKSKCIKQTDNGINCEINVPQIEGDSQLSPSLTEEHL